MATETIFVVFYVEKREVFGEEQWALFAKKRDGSSDEAWVVAEWDKEPGTAETEHAKRCARQAMRFILRQVPSYVPRFVEAVET